MTSLSSIIATKTASTKRNPSGGGLPTTNIASMSITPPAPIKKEMEEMYRINSPHRGMICYAPGTPDVKDGDRIVIDGVDYPVRYAQQWPLIEAVEIIFEKVG